MNDKQNLVNEILTIVVNCCKMDLFDIKPITNEDILGPSRAENICMTRCIFVTQMLFMGFSRTTIANILHRSEKTIGNILNQAHNYKKVSYAYRLAEAQSTIQLKEIIAKL